MAMAAQRETHCTASLFHSLRTYRSPFLIGEPTPYTVFLTVPVPTRNLFPFGSDDLDRAPKKTESTPYTKYRTVPPPSPET
jgi:hypothetical protein